jgi:hypothetical protein
MNYVYAYLISNVEEKYWYLFKGYGPIFFLKKLIIVPRTDYAGFLP